MTAHSTGTSSFSAAHSTRQRSLGAPSRVTTHASDITHESPSPRTAGSTAARGTFGFSEHHGGTSKRSIFSLTNNHPPSGTV